MNDSSAEASPNAVSLVIGNGSFRKAIAKMEKLHRDSRNAATRDDYKKKAKICRVWVRPNSGPGNPHTKLMNHKRINAKGDT